MRSIAVLGRGIRRFATSACGGHLSDQKVSRFPGRLTDTWLIGSKSGRKLQTLRPITRCPLIRIHPPCSGHPALVHVRGRLVRELARVGQVAGGRRQVLPLSAVPVVELGDLVDGYRGGHPEQRLRHRHEPGVVPAESRGHRSAPRR